MNTSSETKLRPRFLAISITLTFAVCGAEARSVAEIQKAKELRACIAFVSPRWGGPSLRVVAIRVAL